MRPRSSPSGLLILDVAMAKLTQENLVKASPLPVLEQSVKLARLAEEASLVRAPCDGTILEVYARQGERVANTPILQMGDLRQMVCIAEVHEASLKDLEIKKVSDDPDDGKLVPARDYPVTIRSAALEQNLQGKSRRNRTLDRRSVVARPESAGPVRSPHGQGADRTG